MAEHPNKHMREAIRYAKRKGWTFVKFDFRLVLERVEVDEAEADALYARCKDGTLITDANVTYVDFDRQANSLDEAVRSAIADINAAGFLVARIEIDAESLSPQQV